MPVRRFTQKHRSALVVFGVIVTLLAAAWLAGNVTAREGRSPKPILRPPGLLQAKTLCSNDTPKVECRAELRRALAALRWQKHARKRLLQRFQRPVEHLAQWTCIHRGEGRWDSNTGNGYQGGLQMDHSFSTTYGPDMWRKYGNGPHTWTPRDQMIVAERAYDSGRGFQPWPNTARACGLL